MTVEHILIHLINKGIVHKIGDEYFPTSVTSTLASNIEAPNELVIGKIDTKLYEYPDEIRLCSPDYRARAMINVCNVPMYPPNITKRYVLHSINAKCKSVLDTIISNPTIEAQTLIKAITEYYKLVDYPKGFAKFVTEGDLLAVYEIYKKGETLDTETPSNLIWH